MEESIFLIKVLLEEIIGYYQSYCNALSSAQTDQQREELKKVPVRLLMLDTLNKCKQRLMKPEAAAKVIKQKREDQHGGRKVFFYEDVHYKLFPFSPGVEAAVDRLNYQLVRGGSSPTKLLKMIAPDGKHYPLIASKTVEGVELYDLIVQHKDLIRSLDSKNFSQMIFLSLLTNPQDGHFHNYIVKFRTDGQGRVSHAGIVCIDNDMAFSSAALKGKNDQGKEIAYPLIRNGLYFFPQMQNSIDSTFRKQFLKLSAEQVTLNWLRSLQVKNKEYQKLLDQGIFDQKEYIGNEKIRRGHPNPTPFKILEKTLNPGGLQLPIRLEPKTAKIVYKRILLMQELLRNNKKITHDQLFAAMERDLHAHYAKVFKKNNRDILKSLVAIYKESKDELERFGTEVLPNGALEKMHEEDDYSQLSTIAFSTVVFGEKKEKELPAKLAEEWLPVLNWDDYSIKEGELYLQFLGRLKELATVDLHNCEALTDQTLLTKGVFKALKHLVLRGKNSLAVKSMRDILAYRKNLKLTVDITKTPFPFKEMYNIAKEFGLRFEVLCKRTSGKLALFQLGQRLTRPEELLDAFIQRHCLSKSLFDTIIYAFKKHPKPKEVYLDMPLMSAREGTFLHRAAEAKNQKVYDWLIEAGINPKIKDDQGQLAADLLSKESQS